MRRTGSEAAARMLARRQHRLLERTLNRARSLDGYRAALATIAGGLDPFETLRRMPVLERPAIQDRPNAFRDRAQRALCMTSSGSTGTPITIYIDPRARQRRRLQFAAFLFQHGWRPWHRAVTVKLVEGEDSQRLGSARLDRTLLRARHSISAVAPVDQQQEAIEAIDPEILQGLPSVIGELATRAEAGEWRGARLRRIFTNSEAVSPSLRGRIEAALRAPVIDSYAATEAFIAWECAQRDGYHVNMTNVVLEVLDAAGDPTPPGESGRVVITTLDNPSMPLVRYAMGDVAIAGDGRRCPCGRPQPLLPRVLGRQVPLISLRGKQISPWGVLARMYEPDFVRQFQLVQLAPDELEARIVARPNRRIDEAAVKRLIAEELDGLLSVEVKEAAELERLPSGKAADPIVAPQFPSAADARRLDGPSPVSAGVPR